MVKTFHYGHDEFYNHTEFVCDDVADIASLPTNASPDNERCAFGSIAIVLDKTGGADTRVFMLSSDNTWTEM